LSEADKVREGRDFQSRRKSPFRSTAASATQARSQLFDFFQILFSRTSRPVEVDIGFWPHRPAGCHDNPANYSFQGLFDIEHTERMEAAILRFANEQSR